MTARRHCADQVGLASSAAEENQQDTSTGAAVTENSVEGPPCGPVIPLLGTEPQGTSSLFPADGRTPRSLSAVHTATTWRQPECPLTDEWMKMMSYLYLRGCVCTHMYTYRYTSHTLI